MPSDQKRNNGPDVSVPYNLHSAEQMYDYETRLQSVLSGDNRRDGRKLNEMRKICEYFEVRNFFRE